MPSDQPTFFEPGAQSAPDLSASSPLPTSMPHPKTLHGREQAVAALIPLLQTHDRFLITSHARPDGDAIGSSLAAMHLLESMGKQVTVALADTIPRPFAGLPGAHRIVQHIPATAAEVALVLECDSVKRTGFATLGAPITINIDHHLSGVSFASVNWIDPEAPAVGAMLYELAVASGMTISGDLATCLYTAVFTDTVHFTLPSTTAATFALAQQLMNAGADAAGITEAVYHSFRPARLWILGAALRRLEIRGPVAWSAITQHEIEAARAEIEDCEGVINYIIGVDGVRAGFFLRELPGGRFRASLRSKGSIDVAVQAETLGGGGHRNASGCTLDGPLDHAVAHLTRALGMACDQAELV